MGRLHALMLFLGTADLATVDTNLDLDLLARLHDVYPDRLLIITGTVHRLAKIYELHYILYMQI